MALDLSLPGRSRAHLADNGEPHSLQSSQTWDNVRNGLQDTRPQETRDNGRCDSPQSDRGLSQTDSQTRDSQTRDSQTRVTESLKSQTCNSPVPSTSDCNNNSKHRKLERQDSGSGRRLQPARPLALYPTWTHPSIYGVHLTTTPPPGSPAFPLPTSPLLTTPLPSTLLMSPLPSPLNSASLPASPFTTASFSASLPTSPLFHQSMKISRSATPPRSAKSVRFADSDPDLTKKRSSDDNSISWMKWKLLKRQLNDVESEPVSSPKRISPDLPRGDPFTDDTSSVSTGPGSPRSLPRTPTGPRYGGTAFVYPPVRTPGSPKCASSHRECNATLAPPNVNRKKDVDDGLPPDPREWSRDDVHRWLRHMKSVHEIPVHLDRFLMNGKALCLMNLQMFTYRVPLGGKLLYKDFQMRLSRAMQAKGEKEKKISQTVTSSAVAMETTVANSNNSDKSSPTSSASR